MYIDVNLAANKIERIVVFRGDTPEFLTDKFIRDHCKETLLLF